jgi:hypothetical protein
MGLGEVDGAGRIAVNGNTSESQAGTKTSQRSPKLPAKISHEQGQTALNQPEIVMPNCYASFFSLSII